MAGSALNSTSTVTRVATHAAIGSVSEIGSGTATRFAGNMITSGGNVQESLQTAFDPKSMLFDGVIGGVSNSVNGIKKPKLTQEQITQRNIVSSVEDVDNPVQLKNNMNKGNYGEMKMDIDYETRGLKRISTDRVTGLDDATHHGIDGVYESPTPPPKYVIAEAKFGSAKLAKTKDGKQMCQKWIDNRLDDAVGKVKADKIRKEAVLNPENVQSQLVNISKNGEISKKILDGSGNVVK